MTLRRAAMSAFPALLFVTMVPAAAMGRSIGPFAGTPANVRTITPQATSTSISSGAANHVVVPTGAGNGRLFVFLPGSGASPLGYDDIIETANSDGYHAIGLTYDNTEPASVKCAGRPACFGPLHQRVFDGTGSSSASHVSPADGVSNRLAALLGYLSTRFPGEGWSSYLAGSAPEWSRIVVSGHSQGAGEAAYIASVEKVAGVVLFSGVVDGSGSSPLATWLSGPHKTPASRYAALTNASDPWSAREERSWSAIGIPGGAAAQSIDSPGTAGAGMHAFVTSERARTSGAMSAHDEPVADPYVPVCPDGRPQLAKVWSAMLALTAGATSVAVSATC